MALAGQRYSFANSAPSAPASIFWRTRRPSRRRAAARARPAQLPVPRLEEFDSLAPLLVLRVEPGLARDLRDLAREGRAGDGVGVALHGAEVFGGQLLFSRQQVVDTARTRGRRPDVREEVRVVAADDAAVGRDDDADGRVEDVRQLRVRDEASSTRPRPSCRRKGRCRRRSNGRESEPRAVVADVPVNVRVDEILRGAAVLLERLRETPSSRAHGSVCRRP